MRKEQTIKIRDENFNQKKTGEFMFQFDNDEPIKIWDIFDYNKITLSLDSTTGEKFSFVDGNKIFTLFVKGMEDE